MLTRGIQYTTSRSTYRQVIGVEPGTLAPASPVDRLSPQSLPRRSSRRAHGILRSRRRCSTSMRRVFQVKIAESSLYPTLNVVGSAQQELRLDRR